MSAPKFYKYLDVNGAKLTLANRNFRHAKPSEFNDLEELTIRSIFPEDDETALKQIEDGFTDVLLNHLDDTPTSLNEDIRKKVAVLQNIFKKNPEAAKRIKDAKAKGLVPSVFNLEGMKSRNLGYVNEINRHMQGWRILCVSASCDSEKMWTRYAEDHKGIVLRIVPNLSKDSIYQLFRRVDYREKRPSLYESAISFQENSLFGDQEVRFRKIFEAIIYTKTLDWSYENEYRLAIPLMPGEKFWDTMGYHPDEISELYLGAMATKEFKNEIVKMAQAVNSKIEVFQMDRNDKNALLASPVNRQIRKSVTMLPRPRRRAARRRCNQPSRSRSMSS